MAKGERNVNKYCRVAAWITASLVLQTGIYLYFDRVWLAPEAAFQVNAAPTTAVSTGQAYYSRDRRYMALAPGAGTVEIYAMPQRQLVRTIPLSDWRMSYFHWLDDRNLALIGLYRDTSGQGEVALSHIDPQREGNEITATIKDLPRNSQISDVVYSTATNVVYIQIKVGGDSYRVYRTDADRDVRRIPLATSHIGRIGILYDQDALVYDDLVDDTVLVRYGNGSWRIISPPGARYRLVGVDRDNNIYIARLNEQNLAASIWRGRLHVGFEHERDLNAPMDARQIRLTDLFS